MYISETQDFISSPYLTHINNVVKNSEMLLANYTDERNRSSVTEPWTYSCEKNKCIRKLHSDLSSEVRVTFLSCAMTCGDNVNIWPLPKSAQMKKTIQNIHLSNIQYKIETPFPNVADLMHKAVALFVSDIKQVMKANGADFGSKSINEENVTVNILMKILEFNETILTMQSDECYHLFIKQQDTSLNISITSKTFFGARHALETLQQLIWYDDAIHSLRILNSVNINDCPKFNYRGLMLDTSRHYFSVGSIKRIITGMAHVKLNRFHWHIVDSQSFPFVSEFYPELSKYGAYSSKEVYTHSDISEIVEFAEVRGIQVITEIDAPAHAGNGWQFGSEKGLGELSLCINQQPWNRYCGEPPCGQLNPKNNNTYMVLEKLYSEIVNLTKTTDIFHLGGDEVNFDCWRQFFKGADLKKLWCDFMIEAYDRLVTANNDESIKYATIWNSEFEKVKCLPAENFTIQVWLAKNPELKRFIDSKYNLIISHVDAWYFDCGFGTWRSTSGEGVCPPFKAWYTVYNYQPWNELYLTSEQMKQILGGEACMWTETVDEYSVDIKIWPRASALAERLWSDIKKFSIPVETVQRFSIFHTRFLDLGLKSDVIWPEYCEQNLNECII
ncbi:hypothetical protein PVAND_001245 [Polypedilum vanderplanki]|uniref:Beta-hexosaminidase n=1 Tax=Polypedilum vanderplanki TaxID=319348 RepID=A0A9J6BNN4_POLVA|nr:hypothetical protein PVAND_001245 [Polypedilum vanderplanki]